MKNHNPFLIAAIIMICPVAAFSGPLEERAEESRQIITRFAGELKSHLKAALGENGPVRAIAVCSETAPEIAARFAARTGWEIGRTSLKYRNPDNAPDQWEKDILQDFHKQRQAGKPVAGMEYGEVVEREGRRYFRYMKAIGTREVCLACHGSSLAPETAATIDRLYPGDRARGFAVGDIRGAFSIVQPLGNAGP